MYGILVFLSKVCISFLLSLVQCTCEYFSFNIKENYRTFTTYSLMTNIENDLKKIDLIN